MYKREQRILRRSFAVFLVAFLLMPVFSSAFTGLAYVEAAEPEITITSHSYDFSNNTEKSTPVLGEILDQTALETSGIIWYETEGNSVSFDAKLLKFRSGTTLYIPIQEDTTKITYTQTCSGDSSSRFTYVGVKNGAYYVSMTQSPNSVTIDDITDIVKEFNGNQYIAIYSAADVKITNITLTEYNPINLVTVSGKVYNAAENGISKLSFKNLDDENSDIVSAAIDNKGNYSATLKRIAGNTNYAASVSEAGYKIDNTNGDNQFSLIGNGANKEQNFSIITADMAIVSGTLSGVLDSALKDTLKLKLVPSDSTLNTVYLNLTKASDGSYTYSNAVISPDVSYTPILENANDYEITSDITMAAGIYTNIALKATPKALHQVVGSFVTSDGSCANVSKITFTNMQEPDYSYTFDISNSTYSAALRTGEYVTSAEVNGYTAFDHVSIKDTDVINNVYLETSNDTSSVAYQEILKVGKGKDFDTITEALNYINKMTRTDNQRVTINLTDDLYREQIMVNTPNITIMSNNEKAPTVTWYYGIGYSYYSVAPASETNKGYYSKKYAVDQYTKTVVDTHWGTVVEITKNAMGFQSENVTYESSFNRYMTEEELSDGVGSGVESARIDRQAATDADVMSKAGKERSCTMFIAADQCEFHNCSFLSSQDTIYTGNSEESIYFKNCVIEGTTDFICGSGNPVFDNCTLSIYGYSDQAGDGGYITASKAGGSKGYLFYNCKIARTAYNQILTTTKNIYLGRPWGAGTKVLFYNTEVETADLIDSAGYTAMSSVTPAEAYYSEYNTHLPDGTALDTSGRAAGSIILTQEQAENVCLNDYFGNWQPSYYHTNESK
ncbi:pectinesterase family protein [Lachnotalea glycerini]|uniref:Pectinesterase catalytic domain-containing protein n=1 Tax=Lachnotalea glycerini TaxID=1763509 RepID=A0A371JHL3_9FIRM|nr:pectinesterase family protein [Lachnotalea glycerini]RDY32167.1 hypothetical protein CG710_005655 [Lachnotalea glycerini]